MREIKKVEPAYPASNASTYLHELQTEKRGSVVRQDPESGKYYFSEPLYLSFASVMFKPNFKIRSTITVLGMNFKIETNARDLLQETARQFSITIRR
jgi:hypothetical protein